MQIVRTANRIIDDVDSKVHRPLGFSTAGFHVMSAIYMDGPAEPARLARIAGVSQASISSVLNTLEHGGFVTRDRRSADRRVVTVTLTDDGVQACRTATVGQLAVERNGSRRSPPTRSTTCDDPAKGPHGSPPPPRLRPPNTAAIAIQGDNMTAYEDIIVEEDVRPGVTLIRLNRPARLNAMRHESYAELTNALDGLETGALVVTGKGRGFCAGDDVDAVFNRGEGDGVDMGDDPQLMSVAAKLLYAPYPVVAAINGVAVGWGMELALMADCASRAPPPASPSSSCSVGGCANVRRERLVRLQQLVGREAATRLLMTGEFVEADRALQLGLVGEVVEPDQLLPSALDLAALLASRPRWRSRPSRRGCVGHRNRTGSSSAVGGADPRPAVPHGQPSRGGQGLPRPARAALHRTMSASRWHRSDDVDDDADDRGVRG